MQIPRIGKFWKILCLSTFLKTMTLENWTLLKKTTENFFVPSMVLEYPFSDSILFCRQFLHLKNVSSIHVNNLLYN